jgi:hypothetical protein
MARPDAAWIGDLVGAICDPIIVMPGGWGETLPKWLKDQVQIERLLENMVAVKEKRELRATDAEVACYLYTASLEAPLDHDWAQIYLYVAGKAMTGKPGGIKEMPEDIKVEKITDYQQYQLDHIKRWIYDARVKHRQLRNRAARAEERKSVDVEKEKEEELVSVQDSFF